MSTLANKQIVVAGGSSGIGKALVETLAQDNAQVTVTGRDATKLDALKAALPAVSTVILDSADRAAMDAFFRELGHIDHLVLAVSGSKGGGEFRTLELSELRAGFEQKFFPHLDTLQAALPYLKGSVTFITASSSMIELPGTSGLAAVNGALELMVPILAKELKPVRVNAISPGVIDTPWWDSMPAAQKAQTFDYFSSMISVGRIGHAAEVAAAIKAVISNDYINATVIPVNGQIN